METKKDSMRRSSRKASSLGPLSFEIPEFCLKDKKIEGYCFVRKGQCFVWKFDRFNISAMNQTCDEIYFKTCNLPSAQLEGLPTSII